MSEASGRNKFFNLNASQLPLALWLAAAAFIGIVLIGIDNLATTGIDEDQPALEMPLAPAESEISKMEQEIERRLETILCQIEGAGEVSVSVFLGSGTRYEYAVNVSSTNRTINEKDQGGGSRGTTEVNSTGQLVLVKSGQTGKEQPVIVREERPAIQGVLVVADGARDPLVHRKLLRAVETVLDLDAHRISVFSRKGR
ncbi:MAG: hypothetical protein ACOX37_07395 [Bacillota bacterium]